MATTRRRRARALAPRAVLAARLRVAIRRLMGVRVAESRSPSTIRLLNASALRSASVQKR